MAWKKKTADPPAEPGKRLSPLAKLNPRFQLRLDDIVQGILLAEIAIEHHLTDAKTALQELHDFLAFEIEKVTLEIKTIEWESRVDPEELTAAKDWLTQLTAIRDKYPPDGVDSIIKFLDDLVAIVEDKLCTPTGS